MLSPTSQARGVRTEENSVSAAAGVLEQLAGRGTVLVSSHNVVLAQLLEPCCSPLLVQKRAGRLVLTPGVLAETNGLTLLAQSGFDASLEQRARDVSKRLSGRLLPVSREPSCDAARGW